MRAPEDTRDGIEWHRMHRVTPFLNAWKVTAALFVIFLWQSRDALAEIDLPATQVLLIVIGVLLLGALIGLGASSLAWSRTHYGISTESVFLHSGILFRQQKHVRLDRIQGIDVTQPLLARITGFAALKIESAGGAGSNLTLSFLKKQTAQQLRNDLLARAAGLRLEKQQDHGPGPAAGGAAPPAAGPPAPQAATGQAGPATTPGVEAGPSGPVLAPEAPERPVQTLTAGRLIGSLAPSVGMVLITLVFIGVIVAVIVTRSVEPVFAIGAPIIGAGAYWWGRFSGEFNFRVATSPDGIRVRQGLLETKARTIPPGRVQAVQMSQSWLWRPKRWWRITLNVAGYGVDANTGTGTVLYPVATEEEAAQLLYLIQPDLGTEAPIDLLQAGLNGFDQDQGFTTSPRRLRWLDPLVYRRSGYRITSRATLLRTGRLFRSLVVVPHERVQSLGIEQGPLERRLQVVDIALHSTPGTITPTVPHVDAGRARAMLTEVAEYARRARRTAGPERWMENTGAPAAPTVPTVYGGIFPSPTPRPTPGRPAPAGPAPDAPAPDGPASDGPVPDAPEQQEPSRPPATTEPPGPSTPAAPRVPGAVDQDSSGTPSQR